MSQSLVLHLSPLESGALTRLSLHGRLARPLPPLALHRLLRTLARESGQRVHVVLRADAQGSPWCEAWETACPRCPLGTSRCAWSWRRGVPLPPEVRR